MDGHVKWSGHVFMRSIPVLGGEAAVSKTETLQALDPSYRATQPMYLIVVVPRT